MAPSEDGNPQRARNHHHHRRNHTHRHTRTLVESNCKIHMPCGQTCGSMSRVFNPAPTQPTEATNTRSSHRGGAKINPESRFSPWDRAISDSRPLMASPLKRGGCFQWDVTPLDPHARWECCQGSCLDFLLLITCSPKPPESPQMYATLNPFGSFCFWGPGKNEIRLSRICLWGFGVWGG